MNNAILWLAAMGIVLAGPAGAASCEGIMEREVVPMVQVEPAYPAEAAMFCVEGYARYTFIILPDGRVSDVRVLESVPEGVFDVAGRVFDVWRFTPRCIDRVAAATSQAIRGVLRSGDVFARFGGDEFVALLPNTDPDITGDVAERIRQVVREIDTDGHGPLTASLGLAGSRPGDDFARLLERADRALYEAKRAGRDRMRIHTADRPRADRPIRIRC